ncbi:myosin-11-like isoform X3 [Ptychodera flava]|uniref:myosin-11-like isoform X3 n=1 Tax=Ptychodera flava TaxID=63121 RepID=UPI00396A241F
MEDFPSTYSAEEFWDINELDDIQRKLSEDGIDPSISNEDKLRHVWRLYLRADTSLLSALKDVEELRIQQAHEMQEVENYVEHIRSLSDEREQLTLEFESENERLKAENEQLRNELAGGANNEITQMLMQEGLEDVADGTTSEQIAYLLVERARLMDELDAERKRTDELDSTEMDGNKVQHILAKERQELEEERKNIRMTKESLQKDHQDKMRQKDKLIMEIQNEVQKLNAALDKEKRARREDKEKLRIEEDSHITASVSRNLDASTYREREMQFDVEKDELNQRIKELVDELENERGARRAQEATVHKLRAVIERNKKILSEAESAKQNLADEKRALDMKLSFVQKDLEELKEKEKSLTNFQTNEKDLQDKLNTEIKELKEKNRSLALELDSTNTALDRQRSKCKELEEEVSNLKNSNEEKKKEFENKQKSVYQKLESMRLQLETSKDEVAATQKEIVRIQKNHRKELGEARAEADSVRDELSAQLQAEERQQDNTAVIKELEHSVEELTRDRDTLARELQAIISKEKKDDELSKKTRQVEDENRELQLKIDELSRKLAELEHEVKLQKSLNSDLQSRLELSVKKAEEAEKEAESLRSEVSSLSSQLITQYDTSKDGQSKTNQRKQDKLDKLVSQLHKELEVEKASGASERESLRQQLDRERTQVKDLQRQLSVLNEEAITAKKESSFQAVMPSNTATQEDIAKQEELKARNKVLEDEMAKVWNQLKEVLDKLAASEQKKHELELELDRVSSRQLSGELADSMTKQKLDVAERKVAQLQRDLNDTSIRMQAAEIQLRETASVRIDLQQKNDELIRLRNQVQDEKLQRTMQEQVVADLKHQMNTMKDKEGKLYDDHMDLQYRLLDTESKLNITEDRSRSASDMHQIAESSKKALMEQVIHLQKEVETLQIDLLKSGEKLDFQIRKYDEKKTYCKNKLQHAKDVFARQKRILGDHLKQLEDDNTRTKIQLEKELQWKHDTENNYQKLLTERRDLLTRQSELEESYRNSSTSLTTLEYRARYLEQENSTLQSRLDSSNRQKNVLEKLLKEYKLERQKEDITRAITGSSMLMSPRPDTPGSSTYVRPSSGIGTSLGQSFNSGDLLSDGLLGLRSPPPPVSSPYVNGIGSRSYPMSPGSVKTNEESDSGSMDIVEEL